MDQTMLAAPSSIVWCRAAADIPPAARNRPPGAGARLPARPVPTRARLR